MFRSDIHCVIVHMFVVDITGDGSCVERQSFQMQINK